MYESPSGHQPDREHIHPHAESHTGSTPLLAMLQAEESSMENPRQNQQAEANPSVKIPIHGHG